MAGANGMSLDWVGREMKESKKSKNGSLRRRLLWFCGDGAMGTGKILWLMVREQEKKKGRCEQGIKGRLVFDGDGR